MLSTYNRPAWPTRAQQKIWGNDKKYHYTKNTKWKEVAYLTRGHVVISDVKRCPVRSLDKKM